jgi:DNA (cytosine-5)-methyltransferase 1
MDKLNEAFTKVDLEDKPVRVFEASFALKKANIKHIVVGFSEINKVALKCYIKNHGGNIRKIECSTLPDFDLFTAGFPCQAFSQCGKKMLEEHSI